MYLKVDAAFGKAFGWYGEKVGRHPWVFVLGCILVNGLLGIGLLRLKVSNDMQRLYTPENSRSSQDKTVIEELFADRSGDAYFGYQKTNDGRFADLYVKSKGGANVLSDAVWYDLLELNSQITNITVTDPATDKVYTYEDVCARRFGECVVDGWPFLSPIFRDAYNSGNVTYPFFLSEEMRPINLKRLLAGVRNSSKYGVEAEYLKLKYALRQDTVKLANMSRQFESAYLELMSNISTNFDNVELAYAMSVSLDKELDANTDGDVRMFSFTFALMITYASFVSSGGNCVSSRAHLARAGVLAVVLSILGSFGLVSACGVPFTNIVGIMPFLILGIGIDDTFVMMAGWLNSEYDEDIPRRIGATLRTSGMAITLTSLTDFVAMLVGIISVFPSIRMFCVFTGVAVLLCYLNHVTFFAGCIALHGKREKANRHCLTCMTVPQFDKMRESGASGCKVCLCAGAPAKTREASESLCERGPRAVLPKFILFKPVKAVIVLVFMGYLGVSIWGVYNLQQKLLLENLVSPTSHYLNYSQWMDRHFESRFLVGLYVMEEVDYRQDSTQAELAWVVDAIRQDSSFDDVFYLSWLEEYKRSPFYDDSSQEAFIASLKDNFLLYVPRFINDIVFNANETKIIASRTYIQTENVKHNLEQGRSMLHAREKADEASFEIIAYVPWYIYFEQYVAVLPNTLLTVGVAVASMFVISAVFMPHPLVVIYITLAISSILVGVMGFMHWWGLTLSSITMIHLVMSVGFSVDYCAHICHAYMQAEAAGRHARVATALGRMGGPILNGAVSSILGILLLAGSVSYIFSSFFRIMILVHCFGFLHALFFLPVLLSCVGPMPTGRGVNIDKIRVVQPLPEKKATAFNRPPPDDGMPQLTASKGLDDNFTRMKADDPVNGNAPVNGRTLVNGGTSVNSGSSADGGSSAGPSGSH